ncbi:Microtubule integrity mal3 [Fusarium albosuccineum]|uniref:Microtubule integrity mal3 n=1 Tax=Fusarium albosuccineum TaxID=1237068 RepID=A0A8H4PFF0_9HYPO|nr:Microtubule integrity mal3 [Fusarium albosuccineum]
MPEEEIEAPDFAVLDANNPPETLEMSQGHGTILDGMPGPVGSRIGKHTAPSLHDQQLTIAYVIWILGEGQAASRGLVTVYDTGIGPKHQVGKPMPVLALINYKVQDNLEFLQWTLRFWDRDFL